MPTKEELLSSIQPDMKLSRNFFMRIYGYEISFPGFAEIALAELEKAGCSKAREYYQRFVGEYEKKHDEEMKAVASWYRKQSGERKVNEPRKLQEVEQRKAELLNMKKQLLMQKLQR